MLPSVFVSYSREDSDSIQYAVGLLEAGGADVFRDLDDIRFGERWEEVITSKIRECERILVFWSESAKLSEWVGKEYKLALELGKPLVPILLDDTPLPEDLGQFHALTLANFMPKTASWKRYGGWVVGGITSTALVGVLGLQFLNTASFPQEQSNAPEAMSESTATSVERMAESSEAGESPGLNQQSAKELSTQSTGATSSGDGPLVLNDQVAPEAKPEAGTADTESGAVADGGGEQLTEQMQSSEVVLWLIGVLSLLILGWFGFRRYAQTIHNSKLAASEKFVAMVFDEH